ncbi:MAG: ABC transporter permease [Verrucomicrobia bacterium]|nr:ABC transporter permease [Verrucomicrobiota bacterium]
MTFLPIVERELRIASRRNGTYRLRLISALICLGVTAWRLVSLDQLAQSRQGHSLFLLMVTLAFIYCLFAGLALTADCLSQEKRDGTLGLLFLTDLKSHELILGKLAANSLGAIYGLLAILPVLAIALTFGGVTGSEYFRAAITLGNTLFFSLTTGLLLSAICRHERKAFVGGFFLIFLSIAGPILVSLFAASYFQFDTAGAAVLFSPIYPFLCLRFNTLPFPPSYFWWSVASTHLVSWGFLFLAGQIQQSTWQDRPKSSRRINWQALWQSFLFGPPTRRRSFRTRLLNHHPMLWFNSRNRLKPATVWFFLFCMGSLWIWDCSQLGSFMWEADHCVLAVLLLHAILKVWIGVEACARFADDHRSGALELLLTTPLPQSEFFEAHFLALRRQFLLPIVAVFAFDLLVMYQILPAKGFWNVSWLESQSLPRLAIGISMVLLVVDSFALCWVGVWEGLFARSTNRALGVTLAKVMALPWLGLIALGILYGSVLILSGGLRGSPLALTADRFTLAFLISWLGAGVLAGCLLQKRSRHALEQQFRSVASERFEATEPQPTQPPKHAAALALADERVAYR